ncbi:sulfoxide reductase heme-binding subunit YedZ [Rhodoblastus sphagnicola]|uniref:Protein-methionine-sulfoxide reductase heme-binding subunit MsrQ n=1 Tax=Rhodoblastus sphagnicola TaxID=333368 RepID=A0A2S6MXQ7_9HYPH|nr:protein-methionine-sulfoxide reductase heme-binding subunit MsrQ [Rhodoblastus sphagnicola]MBB4196779.1 sulfoxide reductase heme-binding subunit YedZ [Rhodoblastus sphagnicola]PPQ27129.1 sulfoxide reductase heme-binding subunit YedZ [Rhodoblastus sphagnicola]
MRRNFPVWAVYGLGFVPAVAAFGAGLSGLSGPDPIRALEQSLGLWALRFLLAALCVTPLRRFAGVNLLRYRRALGLLSFYYAALHFLAFIGLDHNFDWAEIGREIVKKPYAFIGMACLLLLIPLAATSSNGMIKRLGAKNWTRLHRLVYPAALLAVAHFIFAVKSWPLEPLLYAGAAVSLLALRLAPKKSRSLEQAGNA